MATRRRRVRRTNLGALKGLKGTGMCKATTKKATFKNGQVKGSCIRIVAGGKASYMCPCAPKRRRKARKRSCPKGQVRRCARPKR